MTTFFSYERAPPLTTPSLTSVLSQALIIERLVANELKVSCRIKPVSISVITLKPMSLLFQDLPIIRIMSFFAINGCKSRCDVLPRHNTLRASKQVGIGINHMAVIMYFFSSQMRETVLVYTCRHEVYRAVENNL